MQVHKCVYNFLGCLHKKRKEKGALISCVVWTKAPGLWNFLTTFSKSSRIYIRTSVIITAHTHMNTLMPNKILNFKMYVDSL